MNVEARLNAPFLPNVGGLQSIPGLNGYHIIEPGTENGGRLHQLDIKFSKIFKSGRTRTMVGLDIYNTFNVDTITGQDNGYTPVPGGQAVWQVPNLILQARFIKFSAQFDF